MLLRRWCNPFQVLEASGLPDGVLLAAKLPTTRHYTVSRRHAAHGQQRGRIHATDAPPVGAARHDRLELPAVGQQCGAADRQAIPQRMLSGVLCLFGAASDLSFRTLPQAYTPRIIHPWPVISS
jgi:hypothetical protein